MAAGLQKCLKDYNQKWLIVTASHWIYQIPTNSLVLYIELGTEQYFYKDLISEDRLYSSVPSLWPS